MPAIVVYFGITYAVLSMQGCKVFRSTTKDVALETVSGFMRPLAPEEIYSKSTSSAERLPLNEVSYVLQLDPYEVEAKGSRMLLAPNGENMLVVDTEENLPSPAFSIAPAKPGEKRKISQWTELIYANKTETHKMNMFVKHELDSDPVYTPENIYVLRFPFSTAGDMTAVLVPWTRHFRGDDGQVFYRIGNSVVSTISNEAVLQFQPIGRYVWKSWGVYKDPHVCSGTVFWNELHDGQPTGKIFSYSKDQSAITKWSSQGSYMNLEGEISRKDLSLPAVVEQNLQVCEEFSAENPPLSPGVDTNLLDPFVYPLASSDWADGSSVTQLSPKKETASVSAFDAQYEYEADVGPGSQARKNQSSAHLHAEMTPTLPFSFGSFYEPGTLIQIENGTIQRVVRTVEHIGWFKNYYTYDTVNYSSDRDGKVEHLSYKLDSKGRITEKKHIRTFASQMAKDIERIDAEKESDLKTIAARLDANRAQLKNAEIVAAQVDNVKKIVALTVTNYAIDQIGRKFAAGVLNKNLAFSSRLKNAGVVAGSGVMSTAILDWVNNPQKPTIDRAQLLGVSGLTAGSAWFVYAASSGLARVTFIAGVGTEAAFLIQQRSLGYNTPTWFQTGGRLVIGGTSASTQLSLISMAQDTVNKQGLTGAAAQSVIDKARMQARFISGSADIARLYFQDNLTVSAASGSALETAISAIPADPVHGIPKAMAQTLARQLNALFQLTESMVRNQKTSTQIDVALSKLHNKQTTINAISVMESFDSEVFYGLDSKSNGSNGVPSVISKAKSDSNR